MGCLVCECSLEKRNPPLPEMVPDLLNYYLVPVV